MKLLIDTHVLLWWQGELSKIGDRVAGLISDGDNQVFVSAASVWEIAIKRWTGKMAFLGSPSALLPALGFQELAITAADGEAAGDLDWSHTDPFDRVIVAQALRRDLTLITADRQIREYSGVATIAVA